MIGEYQKINTERIFSIRSPTNREYGSKQLLKHVSRPYSILKNQNAQNNTEGRSRNVMKLNKNPSLYEQINGIRLNTEDSSSTDYTKESIFTLTKKSSSKLSRTPTLPFRIFSIV